MERNIMEEVRKVVNQLYTADRASGIWHDYRVDFSFRPNPLNYDGCDSCCIEVHEFKKELRLGPEPYYEFVFDKILFESKHHFSIEEALNALAEQYHE